MGYAISQIEVEEAIAQNQTAEKSAEPDIFDPTTAKTSDLWMCQALKLLFNKVVNERTTLRKSGAVRFTKKWGKVVYMTASSYRPITHVDEKMERIMVKRVTDFWELQRKWIKIEGFKEQ